MHYLDNLREAAKEAWANESYCTDDESVTLMMNAGAIERVKLLAALMDLDYEELADGLDYKVTE